MIKTIPLQNEEEVISMNEKVSTKVMAGFMELLPKDQIVFDEMLSIIRNVYEQYGFISIDTPVIEKAEVLLAKVGGETAKQIYRFKKGENDLALRFDLTVPLARYVSEHSRELAFPFRRYHIGKVYRGENPQKGRYREFYQCDIDIIGNGSLSLVNDAEITKVIYDVFTKMNIGSFVIRISNRKLIIGLLNSAGVDNQTSVEVMRTVDKIEKVGPEEVNKILQSLNLKDSAIKDIFQFLDIKGTPEQIIEKLQSLDIKNEIFQSGVSELSDVIKYMDALGVPKNFYNIDLTIARGLDYYTGTVYETVLVNYPSIGSICSGGRYDNLAEKYTNQKLPGVGISIGLTRLFSQLKDANLLKVGASTRTKVLIIPFVENFQVPLEIATELRKSGIITEIYFEEGKMKKKLSYADKLSIPFVVFVGQEEISSKLFTIKNMASGEQVKISKEKIYSYVNKGEV